MRAQFNTALVSIDELGGVVIALVGRTFLLEVACSRETALNLGKELCAVAGLTTPPVATRGKESMPKTGV